MLRPLFHLALFFLFIINSFAQEDLYMPRETQKAYENKTRSREGMPGVKYWQNHSDYIISVKLHAKEKKIEGSEQVVYYNESPDSLKTIVIRLYQDIFKKGNPRDEAVHPEDIHDGVIVKSVKVNDVVIDLNDPKKSDRKGTNLFVTLPDLLFPSGKAELKIEWEYPIQKTTQLREGVYNDSSFFIAYWYPQIAVYDDLDGWDVSDYTGTQEFYNDFNNYQVEIKVPQDYVVWATGELQNPEEVLTEKYLKRYLQARQSEEVVKIIPPSEAGGAGITNFASWKFKADSVTDFTFASSSSYIWEAASVLRKADSQKRVFVSTAYHPAAEDYPDVAQIALSVISSLSNELPGIEFPFPTLTIFHGSGGMEFPMMINDGSYSSNTETVYVTAHEIAHMYFPFMMGINERKYAWMDEGWAQMLPTEIQLKLSKGYDFKAYNSLTYTDFSGTSQEVPMMIPSGLLKGNSYGIATYFRSGVAYEILKEMLGEELFKKALNNYYETWKGKHPIPYDFFYLFNKYSGKDLNWFWKAWFFELGYPDLEILKVNTGKKTKIHISKKGKLPVPVSLKIVFEDGSSEILEYSAGIWENKATFLIEKNFKKPVKKIELGNSQIPDIDWSNNLYDKE